MAKKNGGKRHTSLFIRADDELRQLLERLIVHLMRKRGKIPKKSEILREAIIEKARRHGVR